MNTQVNAQSAPGSSGSLPSSGVQAGQQEAASALLSAAKFVLRGMESGHIKCAPYFDFDPNAEQLEFKSPVTLLREAIAKVEAA